MSSTPSRTPKSAAKSYSTRNGSSSTPTFTEAMQDRQARNKDPYSASDESDSPWEGPSGRFDAYGNDSYANIQLRREAAIKLDNPELVMMLAMARNDSIPATRHHLTKIMCGYLTKEELDAEDAQRNEKEKEKEAESSKAKQGRASGSRGNRS